MSGRGVLINDPLRDVDSGGLGAFSILHLDPPVHAAYRSVVNRLFTPRSVAPLEARIRQVVRRVLDAVPTDEPVDLVDRGRAHPPGRHRRTAGARRLRRRAVAPMVGRHHRVGRRIVRRRGGPDGGAHGLPGRARAVVPGRPGRAPGCARHHARRDRLLDEGEVIGFLLTLLVAGNETTRTLVSGGAEALARHPDQQALLAGDPSLLARAVEEMLRWVTPIQALGRTAVVDVELAGTPVPAGTFLVMLYVSANRDEAAFGLTRAASMSGTRPPRPTWPSGSASTAAWGEPGPPGGPGVLR